MLHVTVFTSVNSTDWSRVFPINILHENHHYYGSLYLGMPSNNIAYMLVFLRVFYLAVNYQLRYLNKRVRWLI